MGRDAAQTEDGRYRLLVEAVTDYAIWVLILIVSHNLGLCTSSRCGIGMRQIGPQIDSPANSRPSKRGRGGAAWSGERHAYQ
jgi:hypothetical protein